jgi:Tol biopolymer transport system component
MASDRASALARAAYTAVDTDQRRGAAHMARGTLRRRRRLAWLAAAVVMPLQAGTFELVTRTDIAAVIQPNGSIQDVPDASTDGRYVVFTSFASNLVAGDINRCSDIFLADRQSGAPTLELVSVNSAGTPGDGCSTRPTISADGRFVAFQSASSNLDAGAPGGAGIYLRDRQAGTTRRIDLDGATPLDAGAVALSRNGAWAALLASNGVVYRKDLDIGTAVIASLDPLGTTMIATDIAIADDGSVIAFLSASNAPSLGDSDGASDVFLRDLGSNQTEIASLAQGGGNPAGGIVSFAGATRWLSGSGSRVVFNTDDALEPLDLPRANNRDGYLYVRAGAGAASISRITTSSDGTPFTSGDGVSAIAADGVRVLIYGSVLEGGQSLSPFFAKNVDTAAVFSVTRDPLTPVDAAPISFRTTAHTLQPDGLAALVVVSDGRYVVGNDSSGDVLTRFPLGSGGAEAVSRPDSRVQNTLAAANDTTRTSTLINRFATGGVLSADGNLVLLVSDASNLVAGDSNRAGDLFLRDRGAGTNTRLVEGVNAARRCEPIEADLTPDGRYVAFESCAALHPDALATGQSNGYLLDRQSATIELVSRLPGAAGAARAANGCTGVRVSDDGQRVLLYGADLAGDGQGDGLFLRDRGTQAVQRLSISESGSAFGISGYCSATALSADGAHVLIASSLAVVNANPPGQVHLYARRVDGPWDWITAPLAGVAFTDSSPMSMSGDGRYVLFYGARAGANGLYLRDRTTATTTRVDVGNSGAPLSPSFGAIRGALSDNGRYAVFASQSDGFAAGEGFVGQQLYLRDLQRGVTARLSVRNDGALANDLVQVSGISADGRWILLAATATNLVDSDLNGSIQDLFLTENPLFGDEVASDVDTLTPASTAPSLEAAVSASGRYVVFESLDPRLQAVCPGAPAQPTLCPNPANCPPGSTLYVFRLDTALGCVDLVTTDAAGKLIALPALRDGKGAPVGDPLRGKPSLSADGLWVTFVADDAVVGKLSGEDAKTRAQRQKGGGFGILLRNMQTGVTRRLGGSAGAGPDPGGSGAPVDGGRPQLAPNGGSVVYTGLLGGKPAVLQARIDASGALQQTLCVSCRRPDGASAGPPESFTEPLDGFAHNASVSADGRLVAYQTVAKDAAGSSCNNGAGNASVVLRHMQTGSTRLLNQPRGTGCQLGSAGKPRIDYSGTRIVFESTQPLLAGAGGSDPARPEVYLFDLAAERLSQVSVDALGGQVDAGSGTPSISGDGRLIAFTSTARQGFGATLPAGAPVNHVVVRELRSNTVNRLSKNLNGLDADADSFRPALSYTGEFVVFDSVAANLSPVDGNGAISDVFLRFNPLVREVVFGSGFD